MVAVDKLKALISTSEFKETESPNKNQMMAELVPKNDEKEYQNIAEDFKKVVKEQGIIEAL